jgi:hypothetical protein
MHFELLEVISLNGRPGVPNDDRCGMTATLAWVVDGATDLGPPGVLGAQGGAAWLATAASAAFSKSRSTCIEDTCKTAFAAIEAQFEAEKVRDVVHAWEVPKAAFALAQLSSDGLSVAWAADSPVLHIAGNEAAWCTGLPDTSAEAADALALGEGVGAPTDISGAVLEDRRNHRSRAHHEALSSNAAASFAVTRSAHHPVAIGDELLLMSDGFASLVTDYKRYTATELAATLRVKGLAKLAQEIREIEQEDAGCVRYPRFKVSDDATALWLKVSG